MSAKKLKLWEPMEAGENGKTRKSCRRERGGRGEKGGGRGEGEVRSSLCKLIFPLFSFQLQIASDSSLKYTHGFFDSFLS